MATAPWVTHKNVFLLDLALTADAFVNLLCFLATAHLIFQYLAVLAEQPDVVNCSLLYNAHP